MDTQSPRPNPQSHWISQLRQRFSEVARRRVPSDAVEDLVQDALSIVWNKGPAEAIKDGRDHPSLRWSFNVLRNVIGNYYQKRRSFDSVDDHEFPDEKPDVLAAMTMQERSQSIRAAVDELKESRPSCAHWLWSMAQGIKAGVLAEKDGLEHAAFYRKIYRCRKMLAEILQRRGVSP